MADVMVDKASAIRKALLSSQRLQSFTQGTSRFGRCGSLCSFVIH